MSSFHTPVLLKEVIEALKVEKGKKYIDATYGGGGHAREIERRGGEVLGIDVDTDTGAIHGNFRDIREIAKEHGFVDVDGILFDLGVSSHQLDTPGRGFSYRFTDAPLDLRMNQSEGVTAAQLVNQASSEELYEIFARYAEEELARPIAHAILSARAVKPIETTGELLGVIEGVTRDPKKRNAVLSRVFQALRIAVNEELHSLRLGLVGAKKLLNKKGRLVVLTFHSLEDRIVKQFVRAEGWNVVTKKPIVAGYAERARNPRSRSAKLRIAEKYD